jgi:heme/copper-type cytochrome/quinol oxidase subunit 2
MRTLFSILFGLSLVLTPAVVLAQGSSFGSDGSRATEGVALENPLAVDSLEQFLSEILKFIVRLGTIVVIVMIVVVGFMFVSARGNPEEIKKAREALLWTLVGAVILIGAEILANAIKATVEAIGTGS